MQYARQGIFSYLAPSSSSCLLVFFLLIIIIIITDILFLF